jgi:hypothetical protein
LAIAKFASNNIVHSSTQQIFFFVYHGLHPKFDIKGVNKIMNLVVKDQAMWLAMFEFNLYLTLNKHKSNTKKMFMNIGRYNLTSMSKTEFGFNNNIYQKAMEKVHEFHQ